MGCRHGFWEGIGHIPNEIVKGGKTIVFITGSAY